MKVTISYRINDEEARSFMAESDDKDCDVKILTKTAFDALEEALYPGRFDKKIKMYEQLIAASGTR